MPELISIEEAARITGFPYEEIEDWVKSRKITSFHTRTGTCMVDPENLRDFIAHIEHLGIQKLYLQLVIQDKEEEADEIIAQYDDYLFCLRSLKNISPLLKQIIAELSTFIDDKQDRYIFTEITSGAKILDVAKRISLPVLDTFTYVFVLILSWLVLKEKITRGKLIGNLLIVAGVLIYTMP